jgi:Sap, sulfolipid-1-addressing protein
VRTDPRSRANGPAFVLGWLVGLCVIGAIVLLAAPDATSDDGSPSTWSSVLKLVLGLALTRMALKQWRSRPSDGAVQPTPRWMEAIDGFNAPKAAGVGAVLSGANPKNLVLALAAAATIAETGISGGDQAAAYAVFALIGTLAVAAPVVVYFALGARAAPILDGMKTRMTQSNTTIMAVLLLVIGAKLIGDAITGFSS